jgi:hypothetical protein
MAPPGADPDEVVRVVAEAFASGRAKEDLTGFLLKIARLAGNGSP